MGTVLYNDIQILIMIKIKAKRKEMKKILCISFFCLYAVFSCCNARAQEAKSANYKEELKEIISQKEAANKFIATDPQRAIKEYNVAYSPNIQVWHPKLDVLSMSNQKIYNYAYGYAAIMRKNCNLVLFGVFIASLMYQLVRYILNILSSDQRQKYLLAIKGRIDGFLLLNKSLC